MTQLNALRHSLKSTVRSLDLNGNGTLATQEVSRASVPAEVKKVLSQAISRAANSAGGQSVQNVQAWVDRLVDQFEAFDADRSGRLSAAELAAAPAYGPRTQLKAMEALVGSGFPQHNPVTAAFDNLRAHAALLDANGNGSLATQEVSKSDLSAEQKKVLSQAISRAANSAGGQAVDNVQRWLSTFEADFQRFDADADGVLSDAELGAADPFRQQAQLRATQALLAKRQETTHTLWS